MNISIFAQPSFLKYKGGHLMRGSSVIRGEQVAEYTGAKLNPESSYEDDVCIYVKPHTQSLYAGHQKLAKCAYIDIVDSVNLVLYLTKNPSIPVIACSRLDYEYLSRKLKNKIVFIPQHHCNFERAKRTRINVTRIGIIGLPQSLDWLPENFEKRLSQLGVGLVAYSGFQQRQDVVDFYKKIDVQVVWRPWRQRLQNPLKVINAASFGIPTIALNEPALKEVEGCYFPVETLDDFMVQLKALISSPHLYNSYAEKCLNKAEEYHIEKIGKLYQDLCTI